MENLTRSAKIYVSKRLVRDRTLLQKLETVRRWLSGILLVLGLFITALVGFIVLSPIYLTCFALRLHCAQWVFDMLTGSWFAFAVASYEVMYGIKIVIQGDVTKMTKNRCSLIVMNHRTRLDWLFYFAVQARYGSLRRLKIVLKNEIRHIPGAGWAMQGAQFMFLKRKWAHDRESIINTLKYFQKSRITPQLLLFPEGTDFQPFSRQRSREYAEKNDLEDYDYVLHPRTLGFTSILSYMKEYNGLDQVVDVTVSYPENVLQNETDLVTGNVPRVIVFTIKTYDLEDLPTDNDALLARWIEERWQEKEAFLREFYKFKDYSDKNGYSYNQNLDIERETRVLLISALLVWIGLLVVTWYGIYVTSYCGYLFTWCVPLCIVLSSVVGFDIIFQMISSCK